MLIHAYPLGVIVLELRFRQSKFSQVHQMAVFSFFSFAEQFSSISNANVTNNDNGYRQIPAMLTFKDIQVLVKAVNELCEPKVVPSTFDLSPRLLLISLDLFNMALKYVYHLTQYYIFI